MNKSNFKDQKPSCPKDFFAKLYGHLEDKKETICGKDSVDRCFKNYESISRTHNFENSKKLEVDKNVFQNSNAPQRCTTPALPLLSTVISKAPTLYCTKTAFTAGITAFCKFFVL